MDQTKSVSLKWIKGSQPTANGCYLVATHEKVWDSRDVRTDIWLENSGWQSNRNEVYAYAEYPVPPVFETEPEDPFLGVINI